MSEELWAAVQARERRGPARGTRRGKGAVPRTLLGGGLVTCFECGGAIVAVNRARYGCSVRKDRGPSVCSNAATIKREVLEEALLHDLQEELISADALNDLDKEIKALLSSLAGGADQDILRDRRLKTLGEQIDRLVEAISMIGMSEAISKKLAAAETERERLLQDARSSQVCALPSADDIIAKYRSNVQNLKTVLENEPDVHRVRALLSEILGPVVIGKDAATGELWAEMEKPAELLLEAATGGSLGLVAGARIDRLLTSIRRIRLSP